MTGITLRGVLDAAKSRLSGRYFLSLLLPMILAIGDVLGAMDFVGWLPEKSAVLFGLTYLGVAFGVLLLCWDHIKSVTRAWWDVALTGLLLMIWCVGGSLWFARALADERVRVSLAALENPTTGPGEATPQSVRWRPRGSAEYTGPGITIEGTSEGIPWTELQEELQEGLLHQIAEIPKGSTLETEDYLGTPNFLVRVVDPQRSIVAYVSFGDSRSNLGQSDGLIRLTSGDLYSSETRHWFHRYSDGSYRRASPWFGPVSFCEGRIDSSSEICEHTTDVLPPGVRLFSISWEYTYIPHMSKLLVKLYRDENPALLLSLQRYWTKENGFDLQDTGSANVLFEMSQGLLDGSYRVELYVDSQLLRSAQFTIGS